MSLRITRVGATGWVGKALAVAIRDSADLDVVAALARSASGKTLGDAIGQSGLDAPVFDGIAAALGVPSDVLIDYTKPLVVKGNVLAALAAGRHVVIGTSGLTAEDYAEIDQAAQRYQRGVLAAGNFSITATLLRRFALEAARYVPDVEVIDYASQKKTDTPSGTGRELAELLSAMRQPPTAVPVDQLLGRKETRGAAIGAPVPVQVHSVRMPSFVLSCEAIFGAADERLVIRHDAGPSAAPYVAGTLLAARKVAGFAGLRRGLDSVLDSSG